MFLLRKPDDLLIERFLFAQKNEPYSYPEVGASVGKPPTGYNVDHNRLLLGHGHDTYFRAVDAVRSWKMFDFPWLKLCWPDTTVEVGSTVGVLIEHLGFWSLNVTRVVYLIEETGEIERYGFAYGTLTDHAESGEERFSVEYHRSDSSVWYDLFAFSRPRHVLARLGYPISRLMQKRFATASKAAMSRAVSL